jgi:uncharacterized protein YbjT (DUF2867 family)
LPFLPLARADAKFAPVYVGDVVAALARALEDRHTHCETYQLCGPDVLTLRAIVCYVRGLLRLQRPVFGIPDAIGATQAFVMDFLPGKPLSIDNFRSLSIDSICSDPGLARLGIRPASMRSVVPGYLGPGTTSGRYARFRSSAGRNG